MYSKRFLIFDNCQKDVMYIKKGSVYKLHKGMFANLSCWWAVLGPYIPMRIEHMDKKSYDSWRTLGFHLH